MKKFLLTIILSLLFCLLISINDGYSQQYSKDEICASIYIIEGGENANQYYGINPKYVTCDSKKECKQICINTIENKFNDWKNQNEEKDFLKYLAKKYCPLNWKIWLKNLRFYLNKGENK
ncbi:MAG: hypothetical protein ACTSXT_13285 [Candidatus Helarchaeota archaeon]